MYYPEKLFRNSKFCQHKLTAMLSSICKERGSKVQKLLENCWWANTPPSQAWSRTHALSAVVWWLLGTQRLHTCLITWWTRTFSVTPFENMPISVEHNVVATKLSNVPDVHNSTNVRPLTNETTHQLKVLKFITCTQTFKSIVFSKTVGKSEQAMIRNVVLELSEI